MNDVENFIRMDLQTQGVDRLTAQHSDRQATRSPTTRPGRRQQRATGTSARKAAGLAN
jgi:hypothetical protein